MDKQSIIQYQSDFDKIVHFINSDDGSEHVEVWFACELQVLLGYARWKNFLVAIHRAVDSCKTQSISVDGHFREVTKMVEFGNGAKREVVEERIKLLSRLETREKLRAAEKTIEKQHENYPLKKYKHEQTMVRNTLRELRSKV